MIRAVIIFLLVMVVIAWVGRLLGYRLPGPSAARRLRPPSGRPPSSRPPAPVLCIHCGTPIPGGGTCPCGGSHRKA